MTDPGEISLGIVRDSDAEGVLEVIHAAFGARAHVDPPPPALSETVDTVAAEIRAGSGVVARVDGRVAGVILLKAVDQVTTSLIRVSVHPRYQRLGVGAALVEAVQEVAAAAGFRRAELVARREFPEVVAWWQRRGYRIANTEGENHHLVRRLPILIDVPTAEAMQEFGAALAGVLRPGDLVLLNGGLGAGKTTLTQGIGAGLGVTEAITSPTFVISRIHPAAPGRPKLVHVDAYRLGSLDEVDDLDLEETQADAVTIIEWGADKAEQLAADRLEIELRRSPDPADETRLVLLAPIGARWAEADLDSLLEETR